MRRITLSLFLMLSIALQTVAQWRSSDEAGRLAIQFLKGKPAGMHRLPSNAQPQLAYVKSSDDTPLLYAFNIGQGDGFVLVSGNENAPVDVLGYSFSGRFDEQRLPCGLEWLLECYAEQLTWYSSHEVSALPRQDAGQTVKTRRKLAGAQSIAPLIETRWGQDAPYNLLCPAGCPTGCVVAAISQLCYKYKYPVTGTGWHSYTFGGQLYTADFGSTSYEWDKMLPVYEEGAYSDEQAMAVALFAQHFGISVEAQYSPDGTTASLRTALESLYKYFGFDDGMHFAQRENFEDEEWEAMLYHSLQAAVPVVYEGRGGWGGHAFILDGYDDGLFHINWGWDGFEDGYYNLSSLIPPSYAPAGGFTQQQSAFLGIKPLDDEVPAQHAESYGAWQLSQSFAVHGSHLSAKGKVMNCGVTDQNLSISVIAVDQADGSVTEITDVVRSSFIGLPMSYYYDADVVFGVDELQEGHIYNIHPVLVKENHYTPLPMRYDEGTLVLEILSPSEGGGATNGEVYTRNMVVEELTSTKYGYCVRCFVAEDYMNEHYPDNFILIAVHALDEMDMYRKYFLGLDEVPTMLVNRHYKDYVSAYSMAKAMLEVNGETANVLVSIDETQFPDEEHIEVTSHVRYNHTSSYTDHRLLYVVLEDNVGPYYQANGYAGSDVDMNGWENRETYVLQTFDNVARSIYPSMTGEAGILPKVHDAGVNYEVTTTVPIPSNIIHANNLSLVVMLYDATKGEILNADKVKLGKLYEEEEEDAIRAISHPQVVSVSSLDGKLLSQPQKGLNIIRMQDGHYRKQLVK